MSYNKKVLSSSFLGDTRMHVVLSNHTTQSIRKEGLRGSITLLEYITREWENYVRSQRPTMRDLRLPWYITHIAVNGEVYQIGPQRKLWFDKSSRGTYNSQRFYVSEVVNSDGHLFQLLLDRSNCGSYDNLQLVRAKCVSAVSTSIGMSRGSSPRIEFD